MIGAAIIGVVSAAIFALQAFGVGITEGQSDAIIALVGALLTLGSALGVGWWIRSRVTPVKKDGKP